MALITATPVRNSVTGQGGTNLTCAHCGRTARLNTVTPSVVRRMLVRMTGAHLCPGQD